MFVAGKAARAVVAFALTRGKWSKGRNLCGRERTGPPTTGAAGADAAIAAALLTTGNQNEYLTYDSSVPYFVLGYLHLYLRQAPTCSSADTITLFLCRREDTFCHT